MGWDVDYFIKMHQDDSLRALLDAYEEETRIFNDIVGYDPYDDKERQLEAQRDHLAAIKILIDKKGPR